MNMGALVSTPETMSRPQTPDMMSGPSDHTHSRQGSISSDSSGASASSAQQAVQPPAGTTLSPSLSYLASPHPQPLAAQLDPLSREYPKPAQEINVREALARKPMKWTLGHYIKETPTRELQAQTEDREKIARDLEAKKRELLQAKDEIRRLALPK